MKLLIDIDDYAITRIKEFYGIANEEDIISVVDGILDRYLSEEYFDPELIFEEEEEDDLWPNIKISNRLFNICFFTLGLGLVWRTR